jgi:hypothetical protein
VRREPPTLVIGCLLAEIACGARTGIDDPRLAGSASTRVDARSPAADAAVPIDATAPLRDAAVPLDASDATAPMRDAAMPVDANDAGPVTCPTTLLARTVGAYPSASPVMTWWGGGYTIILDQMVPGETGWQLAFEKTDGVGDLLAGPAAITPDDGVSRVGPRVAFSGTEYGLTYNAGNTTTFSRTDGALTLIAGSDVALGDTGGSFGGTTGTSAVAWSGQAWGVAWSEMTAAGASTLSFERFDATGAPLTAPVLGAYGLSDSGVPLIATTAGWALLASGSPGALFEIGGGGAVRSVPLPFDVFRGSLATDGTQYAVVADANGTGAMFARVTVGGGVVAGSVATLGGIEAEVPNVIWTSGSFLAAWTETTATDSEPLLMATMAPSFMGTSIAGAPFSTETNTAFLQLAAGSCGWGVVYDTFVPGSLEELEVRP